MPPTFPAKPRLVVLSPMAGGSVAAARVRETGMVLVVAPVAVTVMAAVWVPAVNPVRFTLAVTVPLLVPETGLRVNHVELSEALQVKVPPPTFDTARA